MDKLKLITTLERNLTSAIKEELIRFLNKIKLEDIFAIAIRTDSNFSTVELSIGTISFIEEYANSEIFESFQDFTGNVWYPEEWNLSSCFQNTQYQKIIDDDFEQLCGNYGNFEDYKKVVQEIFINSLKNIKKEYHKDKIYFFVSISDPNSKEELLDEFSSQQINLTEEHIKFKNRYNHYFDFYPELKIKGIKRNVKEIVILNEQLKKLDIQKEEKTIDIKTYLLKKKKIKDEIKNYC